MATVDAVHTMLLRESVPTATTRVIKYMTSKLRDYYYKLDSHADTCVFGRGALIVYDFNRSFNVQGYDPSLGSSDYSTVTGVHGYLHPHTGMTYHIVTHQGIIIPHLEHHLICPMQARVNDVNVNETPRFLTPEPNGETHAIIVTDLDNLSEAILPLTLKVGVASCLPVFEVATEERESDI